MLYTLGSFLMPPLFVFGIYNLLTWFNILRINRHVFWKRVAMASGVSHVLLATGFFVFSYLDAGEAATFGNYLFEQSNFWKLVTVFDTVPMFTIVISFSLLDRAGLNPPVVALTIGIVYLIGTLQWFFAGGALGAILERFFEGLKTPDPDDEEWMQ
jgi:hypothetical protein